MIKNPDQFKQTIESTFDDVCSRYDSNVFFAQSAHQLVQLLPETLTGHILDLSTGTGAVAIALASRFPEASIEAIDLSSGMLQQAREKALSMDIHNIHFRLCDVDRLDYPAQSFDAITCGYALFFYPDMNAAFQSIYTLLKPGGQLIFSSFTDNAFNPFARRFIERLEQDYGVEPPAEIADRLKNEQSIRELTDTINCQTEIQMQRIRNRIAVDDWWSLLNNAGYKSLLDQLNPDQLSQFKHDHLSEIAQWADDGWLELNTDSFFTRLVI